MKKIILIIVIIIISYFNIRSFAQSITQTEKDSIIANLYSEKWSEVYYATRNVVFYKIYEATPVLQNEIWNKGIKSRLSFIEAMFGLHDNGTAGIALNLFDTLEIHQYSGIDSVSIKLDLILILFELNNFSKIEYISYKSSDSAEIVDEKIINLWGFLLDVPLYEQTAKSKLIRIFNYSPSGSNRSLALYWLGLKNKSEITPDVINRLLVEDDYSVKWTILKEYVPLGEFGVVSELLKESLVKENEETLKREILYYLLDSLRVPSNYYFVKNWLDDESDYIRMKKIAKIHERVFPGKPFIKSIVTNVVEFFDSTESYLIQSNYYSWVENTEFVDQLNSILATAKTNLQNGDSLACRVQVKAFQDLVDNVYKDSLNSDPRFVTIEGWKFLYWNAQYILDRLPEPPANPNLLVNLKNSLGNQIPASNVKYYEGSWKDAVNNGDGTFTVITTRATVSIRVFYEYASQQVDNVPAQNNAYTFTTVNAAVQLKNSLGNLIDVGTVQYYAGAWRSFGTTLNGVAYKELLPINYSFRMTYEYGIIDKQQNLSTDPTVVFQTVNAAVQLKNSLGNLIDAGTVQYYAGAWRTFGTTSNGVAYKELLPVNYSFRMTYEFVSNDKQQNLSTNPVVDFSTVLCSVKVSKTNDNQPPVAMPINNAVVKYYAGAWRNLGTTNTDGVATKELLPANISFRATLGNVSLDKQQDISVNSLVEILLNVP